MIITTTMHIEHKPVQEYKGIVFGEVVEGRNFVKAISLYTLIRGFNYK